MKEYAFAFLCYFFLATPFARAQDTGGFVLRGRIPVLSQPKSMDCWITVVAMMLSWKDGKSYSVAETADKLGDPWKFYFETNTGLPFEDQTKFIRLLQLHGEPPANYISRAYLDFLKAYGPLWITTGDGFSAHARLLIGIEEQDSGGRKEEMYIFIDPRLTTGKPIRVKAKSLQNSKKKCGNSTGRSTPVRSEFRSIISDAQFTSNWSFGGILGNPPCGSL